MLTDDRKDVLEHLGYEWWMFRCAHALLSGLPESGDPVRNALLESLAIHGRNLAYFFHKAKIKPDDWNTTDLGLDLTPMPTKLDTWCNDVHKRIAHLTKTRIVALESWLPGEIRPLLEERIATVKANVGQDGRANWTGDHPTTSTVIVHARALGGDVATIQLKDSVGTSAVSFLVVLDHELTNLRPEGKEGPHGGATLATRYAVGPSGGASITSNLGTDRGKK